MIIGDMQSVKARKAHLDDTVLECVTSKIWHSFHIPSCYLWEVIRRTYVVRFKVGFKNST